MARIRVTRTLVYEGSEEWVRATLESTVCDLDKTFRVLDNVIFETERKEETID